jgi:hypothetical protein
VVSSSVSKRPMADANWRGTVCHRTTSRAQPQVTALAIRPTDDFGKLAEMPFDGAVVHADRLVRRRYANHDKAQEGKRQCGGYRREVGRSPFRHGRSSSPNIFGVTGR